MSASTFPPSEARPVRDPASPLTLAEVMTAAEVAELLQMLVSTVCYLARCGVLPPRRHGRAWRFVRLAVRHFDDFDGPQWRTRQRPARDVFGTACAYSVMLLRGRLLLVLEPLWVAPGVVAAVRDGVIAGDGIGWALGPEVHSVAMGGVVASAP